MIVRYIISLLLIGFLSTLGFSQTRSYKNELGFRSDNDAYLAINQDKYYTNGMFISFRRAMKPKSLSTKVNKCLWEVEIGQEIYNPQSGFIVDPVYIDRPFAGYLYLGSSLSWLYNSESVLKTTLQVGCIGSLSLAREMQTFFHKTVGFYEIKGWDTQVNVDLGLNAIVKYNHLLYRSSRRSFDFITVSYANIGDFFTGLGTGILFRSGSINQLFSSVSTDSRVTNDVKNVSLDSKEFFFYAKPMIHFRAYDATVEGGLFSKDKGPIVFDIKPLVFSQEFGLTYATNRWTMNFSIIFKSKEIKSFAKPDQYGSASCYYRF